MLAKVRTPIGATYDYVLWKQKIVFTLRLQHGSLEHRSTKLRRWRTQEALVAVLT